MRKVIQSACCAALLASPAVMAGTTANFGVASEYMFRGIPQTNGAAVQGGLDFSSDIGLYVGAWASNVNFGGGENGNEFDIYGGFTKSFGMVGLDVGAIAYIYSEDSEDGGFGPGSNLDFVEGYVGLTVGPVSGKVYYSPDYNNVSESSLYGTATATFPLSETISVFVQGGSLKWDNVDSYVDMSAGVTGSKDGYSITLGAFGTHGRGPATYFGPAGESDDVKFVISAKKVLEL